MIGNFDSADLYSCDDEPESMHATSADDAIAECLGMLDDEPETVTVYAWKRSVIGDAEVRSMRARLVGAIEDFMDDNEFTGDDPLDLTPEVETALDALAESIRTMKPWTCERCGERVFNVSEWKAGA